MYEVSGREDVVLYAVEAGVRRYREELNSPGMTLADTSPGQRIIRGVSGQGQGRGPSQQCAGLAQGLEKVTTGMPGHFRPSILLYSPIPMLTALVGAPDQEIRWYPRTVNRVPAGARELRFRHAQADVSPENDGRTRKRRR